MGDLQAAIKRIETSRQTHIEWRDYWLSMPGCEDCESCKSTAAVAGDLDRQVRVIAEYDNVLAVLREKAEDRARVEAVEALADEKERRIAEINAEPDPLTGRHSTMAAFALTTEIRAALAIPTTTGGE